MNFFKYFQFYLFSAVKGRVHDNGTPLVGAKLTRTAQDAFNGKTYTDYAYTDSEGQFELSFIKIWGFRLLLEPLVFQKIEVEYKGIKKLAWDMTKHNLHHYGEIAYEEDAKMIPIEIDCDWKNSEDKKQKIIKERKVYAVSFGIATILEKNATTTKTVAVLKMIYFNIKLVQVFR
ncbi:DUF6795 domain-containing protein [Aliikangiella maris]|uniref:DUF6795 domain-containing protein n=2 Tax=Aliikangiella maris TaxID=3162458 RepID=A0ABV3MRP2_9GAMM